MLAKLVSDNKGTLSFSLNGVKVTLEHKKHFYLDAREMLSK